MWLNVMWRNLGIVKGYSPGAVFCRTLRLEYANLRLDEVALKLRT